MESQDHSSDKSEENSTKDIKKAQDFPKTYIFRDEVDQGSGSVQKSRIWLQEPTEESLKYMKTKLPLFK